MTAWNREYLTGDLVLMDAARIPQDGDIVAVWIDGEGGTLKEFEHEGAQVRLKPLNKPKHQDQVYDADLVRIQGVLIELVRRKPVRRRRRSDIPAWNLHTIS